MAAFDCTLEWIDDRRTVLWVAWMSKEEVTNCMTSGMTGQSDWLTDWLILYTILIHYYYFMPIVKTTAIAVFVLIVAYIACMQRKISQAAARSSIALKITHQQLRIGMSWHQPTGYAHGQMRHICISPVCMFVATLVMHLQWQRM